MYPCIAQQSIDAATTSSPAETTTQKIEPLTTQPGTTPPGTTLPGTTPSSTTPPATTPPATTPPATTQPATMLPATTQPGTTQPTTMPPGTTPAGTTQAGTTQAGTTPPGTTQAGTTQAGTTPPGTTPPATTPLATMQPATTQPATTQPATTHPPTMQVPSTQEPPSQPATTPPTTVHSLERTTFPAAIIVDLSENVTTQFTTITSVNTTTATTAGTTSTTNQPETTTTTTTTSSTQLPTSSTTSAAPTTMGYTYAPSDISIISITGVNASTVLPGTSLAFAVTVAVQPLASVDVQSASFIYCSSARFICCHSLTFLVEPFGLFLPQFGSLFTSKNFLKNSLRLKNFLGYFLEYSRDDTDLEVLGTAPSTTATHFALSAFDVDFGTLHQTGNSDFQYRESASLPEVYDGLYCDLGELTNPSLGMASLTVEFVAALVDYSGAATGHTVSLYIGGDYGNHTYTFSEVFDYTVNYTKIPPAYSVTITCNPLDLEVEYFTLCTATLSTPDQFASTVSATVSSSMKQCSA
ncbi:mucin-2-like [Penaeus monodon]|uniref:mucin-2-like n=1 Tax=Penaeus monodon TaxID=6687 RepID=UPI0018A70A30|nr:mucin-2-like [Penaeus monodon]